MAKPRSKKAPARTPKARPEAVRPVAKVQSASNSAAQPVEKKNMKEVKKLIDLGKEKGYLTYDDVNDMLPAEVVSPDQIDDVMSIFGEMEIEVVDSNQRVFSEYQNHLPWYKVLTLYHQNLFVRFWRAG